jgi:ABC-type sugar transport system ATPase subunit
VTTVSSPDKDATGRVPAISTRGLGKRFGATQALSSIDLDIKAGTIHALVGENGAGKSTLLGILAGRIPQSEGSFEVFGEPVSLGSPRAAQRAGIAAIYQELTIIDPLTAVANVFVSRPRSRAGVLDERAMRQRYDSLSEQFGVSVPANAVARDLSVAQQQILEIMRALDSEARIIFFDEPTAPLGASERESLFALMRDLRSRGVTMVFVSHALDEVLSVADHVTVFRDGRLTASRAVGEWTKQTLVNEMLGRDQAVTGATASAVGSVAPATARRVRTDEGIRVEGLKVSGSTEGIDFELRSGEILGLGGLVGSGRSSVLHALAGLDRRATGRLWVDGTEVAWPRSVRRALDLGIALLPEDRKTQGLVLMLSAAENVVISDYSAVSRRGIVSPRLIRGAAAKVAEAYGFNPARLGEPARNLSGGNQQKLLLARWGHRPPRFLLADEPTRGIDIGAKADILETLRRRAATGAGVLIVSSELEEVVETAERVLVMSSGHIVDEFDIDRASGSDQDHVARILYSAFHVETTDAQH